MESFLGRKLVWGSCQVKNLDKFRIFLDQRLQILMPLGTRKVVNLRRVKVGFLSNGRVCSELESVFHL